MYVIVFEKWKMFMYVVFRKSLFKIMFRDNNQNDEVWVWIIPFMLIHEISNLYYKSIARVLIDITESLRERERERDGEIKRREKDG